MCLIDAIASTAILRIERGVTTFGLVALSTQPRAGPRSDWVLVVTRSHNLVRHVHPNLMRAVGAHVIMCLSGAAQRSERNFHKNLLFQLLGLISERVLRKLFLR